MSPDIILYAIVALILLARLWSLFGTRNDTDVQRPNPFALPAKSRDDVSFNAPQPGAAATARPALPKIFALPPASLAGGLAQIQTLYPAFDEKQFLKEVGAIFTEVVEAFAKGDLAPIEPRLGPAVLAQFKTELERRRAEGQTLDCHVIAIDEAEVTAARVEDKRAYITVRYASEQEITLRDASGAVIGGEVGQHEHVTDSWVFMRDTGANNGQWLLFETHI